MCGPPSFVAAIMAAPWLHRLSPAVLSGGKATLFLHGYAQEGH
jgi:hypothetical protein